MSVCKANDVRTELMKTRYLPQANEACFIPIVAQIEKLNSCGEKKGAAQVKDSMQGQRSSQRHSLELTVLADFSVIQNIESLEFPHLFFLLPLPAKRIHRRGSLFSPTESINGKRLHVQMYFYFSGVGT